MLDVSMVSLKSKLEQEPDILSRVSRIWGIDPEGQSVEATRKLLLDRVQSHHAARSVWEALSREERICLFSLFGSGNPDRHKGMTLESLRKKTKLSPHVQAEACAQLANHWYLVHEGTIAAKSSGSDQPAVFPFRECFRALWHTGQELFRSYADRSSSSLQHLLSTFYGDRLRSLANLCHVPTYDGVPVFASYASPSISHPMEVQNRLYEALCHPLMPFDLAHRRLEPWMQEIFFWLCEQGGKVRMSEVRARLGMTARLFPLVEALEAHALAFDTLSCEGKRWLFIPHDLLAIVKREAQQQAEDEERYAFCPLLTDVPDPQEGQPLLLYDLAVVIGMSLQSVIEPTKDDKLPKRWREKIRPLLHGRARMTDEGADLSVDQLFHAARDLELLRCGAPPGEEKRRYLPGPMLQWSELTLVGQGKRLVKWWATATFWQDIHPNGRLMSFSAARQTLLEILKQCVPGRWYRVDVLLYAIWRKAPLNLYDFSQRKLTKPTPLRSRREQWMEREGETYVGLLASALTELGLVELHSTRNEAWRPELFSVTSFGGEVFAGADDQPGAKGETPMLIVQPNYDMLLMQFEPGLVYRLLSFAQIQRVGIVSSFRLTQQALLRGLAAGMTIEQVITFLAEQSKKTELPQNITYTLADWVKGYKEAHLEEVILVELAPEQAEDLLYRALSDLEIVPRKLSAGIFVVSPGNHSFLSLRRRLEKEGIVVRGEPVAKSSRGF